MPTYAQVVGVVNARAGERDLLITAAGGLPGEVMKNWRVKAPNTFDCEFGFSCMGYEIAAGWGAAWPDPTRTPIVMVGDGTYMMMNSDIYSSVLSGHKMILVVCDNGGYARHQPPAERQGRRRLQQPDQGLPGEGAVRGRLRQARRVDGRAHAPRRKPRRPRPGAWTGPRPPTAPPSSRIVTDAFTWTPGDAGWDVGVPEVSERQEVREAHATKRKAASGSAWVFDRFKVSRGFLQNDVILQRLCSGGSWLGLA